MQNKNMKIKREIRPEQERVLRTIDNNENENVDKQWVSKAMSK